MTFVYNLWALVPGLTDGDKVRFALGIAVSVGTLIVLLWNLYRWATKRDTSRTALAILETQKFESERAAEERRELRELVLQLSAKVESRLASLPTPSGIGVAREKNVALTKDLIAAVERLAADGKQAALTQLAAGDESEAMAELAAARAGIRNSRVAATKDEAAVAREQGAIAFLSDTRKAMRHYEEAARLNPNDADCGRQLEMLRFRMDDQRDAAPRYQ